MEHGKMYYMELLFYQGTGGDHLLLSMIRPGDEDRIIVGADHLYSLP